MGKSLTQDEFIAKAISVHGNKYDYSKVVYVKNTTPIEIICPVHGSFLQTPKSHLEGRGCLCCANDSFRLKKDDFIQKAKSIHGDKYDYSKVDYINNYTKVCIVCPKHGEFWQSPKNHLIQMGCPSCGKESTKEKRLRTNDEFISDCKRILGDYLFFDKTNYVHSKKKVIITCPIHGDFSVYPCQVYRGEGCPKCSSEQRKKENANRFFENANIKYECKYDYSKSIYINSQTKLEVICPKHGSFWITPNTHLTYCGCPHCSESSGEKMVRERLSKYKINFKQEFFIRNDNLLCLNKNFRVDFYLPDYNTIIEYNGIQHYEENAMFNMRTLEQQQERDYALRQYCNENKIKLIEIPYTEYNNIEEILTKELKIHKNKT